MHGQRHVLDQQARFLAGRSLGDPVEAEIEGAPETGELAQANVNRADALRALPRGVVAHQLDQALGDRELMHGGPLSPRPLPRWEA